MKGAFSAADGAEFSRRAGAILIACGARPAARQLGTSTEYELDTRVGKLSVTPYGYWCAMRFSQEALDDAKADAQIRGIGDLNPHSGKWNLQGLGEHLTVDQRIAILEERLRRAGALAPRA